MLVINPEECIDCGVCEPECPIDAIQADTVDGSESWVAFNQKYSQEWPRISLKGTPPQDADDWKNVPQKLENHFSEKPGEGS